MMRRCGMHRRALLAWLAALGGCAAQTNAGKKNTARTQKMANWPEFELLQTLTGRPYLEMRDKLLQSPDLPRRLREAEQAPGWKPQLHRRILEGWLADRPLYERVLADLNAVDIDRERRANSGVSGVWTMFAGNARLVYKVPVLPLCWEGMMKYRGVMEDWKQMAFLRMASALPNALSVEPMIAFLCGETDPGAADFAARMLEVLPREAAIPAIERHLAALPFEGTPAQNALLARTLQRLKNQK